MELHIRSPELTDTNAFINAVKQSGALHYPWLSPPDNKKAFATYVKKMKQPTNKAYLLLNQAEDILGVFNVSEMVRGCFQSAFLGYYAFSNFAGRGLISQGLKLVLNDVFINLKLHRIEANIQPDNIASVNLVKANHFTREGFSKNYLYINGEWQDHERWAMTYELWMNVFNLKISN